MPGSTIDLAIVISAVDSASAILGPLGTTLAGIGTAMIKVGATSAQAAGDFQSSMASLVTGAGESASNLSMVSNGVLDLSTKTGTSTQQLSAGLYQLESAGLHGSQGLAVLQAAAEGAKVGSADLGVTANSLSTILTDYHQPASAATADMNALTVTVASGKTHLQDLASSMGSVLPLASSLGIAFPQVAGALATMTNAGMDAQRASMNLANAIRSLSAPNASAEKSMKAVGLSAQQLKDTLSTQGLTGAISLIEQHVGKTFPANSVQAVQAFKAIMGGATGYNVALMLGGQNMKSFEGNVTNITKAMNAGGTAVQGWSLVQSTFNFQLAQAQQALQALEIRIGTALLPILGKLLGQVMPLVTAFGNWVVQSNVVGKAIAFIQSLITSIAPQFKIFWSLLGDIVSQFISWIVQSGVLQRVMNDVFTAVNGFLLLIYHGLPVIESLFVQILGVVTQLTQWLFSSQNLNATMSILTGVVQTVSTVVSILSGTIIPLIEGFVNWVVQSGLLQGALNLVVAVAKLVQGIVTAVTTVLGPVIQGFANWITQSGILHLSLGVATTGVQNLQNWLGSSTGALKSWGDQAATSAKQALGIGGVQGGGGDQQGGKAVTKTSTGAISNKWSEVLAPPQISPWQQFLAVLGNIGDKINNVVLPAWRSFQQAIASLRPQLAMMIAGLSAPFLTAWDFTVMFFGNLGKLITDNLALAGVWILGLGKTILGGLVAMWSKATGDNEGYKQGWKIFLDGVNQMGNAAWQGLGNLWSFWTNFIAAITQQALQRTIGHWQDLYNALIGHSIVPDLVNGIVAWFGKLPTLIGGAITNLATQLTGKFTSLAQQAVSFGLNFSRMLANGITAGTNYVVNAAINVANRIRAYLGFGSPTEAGPGSTSGQWMSNLITMLSDDLRSGAPQIAAAAQVAVSPIASAFNAPTSAPAPSSSTGNSSSVSIVVNAPGRSKTEAQDIANQVQQILAKQLRQQSIAPRYLAGGTHS